MLSPKNLLNSKLRNISTPGTKEYQFAQAIKKIVPKKLYHFLKRVLKKEQPTIKRDMPWSKPLTSTSGNLGSRILIIAELSLPQCKKYRVDQKVEMLKYLGYDVSVVSWNDAILCRQLLQLHALVIFYRVPGFENVINIINEAKRLNLTTFFDVDDLIFDRELMLQNKNISSRKSKELEEILNGADLYNSVLSSVDHIISSTNALGRQMQRFCKGDLYIIKNCLDEQLLDFAKKHKPVKSEGQEVKIVYGSGTTTHDEDFLEAAEALALILKKYPNTKLYIHGHLNLPSFLDELSSRIVKVPFSNAHEYYSTLSSYDINIAPLEKSIFNDAKSNIKFLEAAIFKTPTVSSRAAEFIDVITDGTNGLLADNTEEWYDALEKLILDKSLRENMGENAYKTALEHYSIEYIADNHFKRLLETHIPRQKNNKKKILFVNVLFRPISFGGATIVVEELARLINNKEEFEVTVFTGFWDAGGHEISEYNIVRYEANSLPIISVRYPETSTPELEYKNEKMESVFDDIIKTVEPDLVHFHSIQHLSASIANSCKKTGIPYTITLHDMWWLCENQFMVMPNRQYCGQKKIDLDFCISNCTKNADFTIKRTKFLKDILSSADLLLTPSEFQKSMYTYNDIDPKNIQVNKNGILFPSDSYRKKPNPNKKVRFAYLGGDAAHKGYYFIKEIFENLERENYELILVDLHRKLGYSSIPESDWKIKGDLLISSGYKYEQEDMDTFFSSIDVLLFPSQSKESFGLTVREALVRDIWVVSTDSGGTTEDIVENENGNIINMDDSDSYRLKIEWCLDHYAFFSEYTNPHKDTIRSYKEQAEELSGYYERVL